MGRFTQSSSSEQQEIVYVFDDNTYVNWRPPVLSSSIAVADLLNESTVKTFASQLVLALERLHALNLVAG
jgi:hypothetical protein